MPRVLVIEDDDLARSLIQRALTQEGYDVTVASNGRLGLAAFRATPMDLVITDLIMPDVEGIELIIEFKRRCPELKIIAMSGGGTGWKYDYLGMAKKLGASRVIPKPFTPGDLCALVAGLLGETCPIPQPG